MPSYVAPDSEKTAYTCPFCQTLAQMYGMKLFTQTTGGGFRHFAELYVDQCAVCGNHIVWWQSGMLRPDHGNLPPAHEDMPSAVAALYVESAAISSRSPRAAAALLRLAMETLLRSTGRTEANLNAMIGALSASGLPADVVKAMDVVRVHGNSSIHAGQIDSDDSIAIVGTLAELLNFVTDRYISQPKRIESLYNAIPEATREAAEERNRKQGSR